MSVQKTPKGSCDGNKNNTKPRNFTATVNKNVNVKIKKTSN